MWLIRFLNPSSDKKTIGVRMAKWLSGVALSALLIALQSPVPISAGTVPVVGLLRYKTDAALSRSGEILYFAMLKAARTDAGFKVESYKKYPIPYAYDTSKTISPRNLSRYMEICVRLRCSHLLMGRIFERNNMMSIESRIFSQTEKKFTYTSTESRPFFQDYKTIAGQIVKKTSLYFKGILPIVTSLRSSKGASYDEVLLSWECSIPGDVYAIYRSPYERGPFIKIGEAESNVFHDTTAEEGLKYWYMVYGMHDDTPGIPGVEYGYRKPQSPKGLTVDDLLDCRNKPWPKPKTEEERERERLHLRLFDKYYENYFMMSFIAMVGRIYINRGELLAYRNFKHYSWDPANRTIYFDKPGVLSVRFFSRRFFRFIRDMYYMKIPYDELLPRVIDNAVLFCIRTGEKEVKEQNGMARFIPNFEAIGMGTEYIRNYENWKSNTIMFATSDEDLYRRIRQVQGRGF
jgi:hypothetical protein